MSATAKRRVAIACQGGGSHAAFAAGVLIELMEPRHFERIDLVGLSGTSGGAVCASLAWSGLVRPGGGPALAAEVLRSFWDDLSAQDPVDAARQLLVGLLRAAADHLGDEPLRIYAPAETRLRELLGEAPRLSRDGRAPAAAGDLRRCDRHPRRRGRRLRQRRARHRPDHRLGGGAAAVPRDPDPGRHLYWDGLFSRNPPIREFTNLAPAPPDEIWIVRINPLEFRQEPVRVSQIVDRRNELSGNLSLDQEIFFIKKINELRDEVEAMRERYRHIEIRQVELALDLDYPSKLDRSVSHIHQLIETGREAAPRFLDAPPSGKVRIRALAPAPTRHARSA